MFLHILRHIDTHDILFVVKQILCQCLCKLCFTDTSRTEEQERTNRFGRIFDACFGTDNCFGYFGNTFILTYDTLMQCICQMKCFIPFGFGQFCNRNTGPAGNNPGNFFIRYTFTDKG